MTKTIKIIKGCARRCQIKMGVGVEAEHTKTIKFIQTYYKAHKRFPKKDLIFSSIAADHLKEDPKYYTKLKKAKL